MCPRAAALPKPRRVLVEDFAVDPSRVGLDQGIGPRLQAAVFRGLLGHSQYGTAMQVQSAISETLVAEIRKMGLPAERASPGTVPGRGDAIVQGQVERISEGNRTRRLAIGFGRREERSGRQRRALSRQRPGLGAPAAILRRRLQQRRQARLWRRGGERRGRRQPRARRDLGRDRRVRRNQADRSRRGGQRLAERLSYNLGTFFAQEGWIAQSAVPTSFVR